jgi:radical SAM protein with 4Fe4S-binding SPASM domain
VAVDLAGARRLNRLRLVAAYLRGAEPRGAVPTAAYIETTSRCNLSCPMCARQLADESWVDRDMTRDEIRAALDALAPECELVLPFAGGEPLLRPDIADIVAACGAAGRRTELATNATLLDGRRARDLLAAGLTTLVVSLDAASAETYSRVRRGGDFERTCANVHRFLEWKRRLAAPTWVVVQMIALSQSAAEVAAFRARWRGVRGVDAVRIKADEVRVDDVQRGRGRERGGGGARRGPCYFPWLGPVMIRYDGAVYPCCHGWQGEPVGHVERESTRDIWNGAAMRRLRAAHLAGRLTEYPACARCRAVSPRRSLVVAGVLAPPHVTRRAIPYAEAVDRLLGRRLIR